MKLNNHKYIINSKIINKNKKKEKKQTRKTILKSQNIYFYTIIYKEMGKIHLIILLSEYLCNILKYYTNTNQIKLNLKLIHTLQSNINILGKYLSKELIKNPRQFKFLFKKFTKND